MKMTVAGRVGSDPQIQHFQSGAKKATFSVAVNRTREITDWYEVQCWQSPVIDKVIPWIKKGSYVSVQGQLVIDQWDDRQSGETRSEPILRSQKIGLGPKQEPKKEASYDR